MPSLSPLSYLILALICGAGVVEVWSADPDADQAFSWWRLMLAAFLLALVYERMRSGTAALSVLVADISPLRLGCWSGIDASIVNKSANDLEVRYALDLPETIEVSNETRNIHLNGEATTPIPFEVKPVALADSQWSRLPIRILGPLRLAWWSAALPVGASIHVVPDSLGHHERSSSGLVRSGAAAQRRQGSGRELHHLRQYRPGDPRHTIDWKATARSGELITRVFGEEQHLEIVLVVDAGRTSRNEVDGLSQLGHYVNTAARFAERAVANEDRIGLIAISDRPVALVAPDRGLGAVRNSRQALAGLATEPVESDMLAAAHELGRMVRHRSLVIVLTDFYGSDPTSRLGQSIRRWVPKHLPMVVGLIGSEVKEIADREAREWLDPYESLAAMTYQQDVHRGMAGLRRLGAETLLARPGELEQAVIKRYQLLRVNRRV